MKRKIIGILVVTLLIATVIPVLGTIKQSSDLDYNIEISFSYPCRSQILSEKPRPGLHKFVNNWGREAHDLHIVYDTDIADGWVTAEAPAIPEKAEVNCSNSKQVDVYGKFPPGSSLTVYVIPIEAKIKVYWWTTICGQRSGDITVRYPDPYPWNRNRRFKGEYKIENEDCNLLQCIYVDSFNIDGELQITKAQREDGCELEFEGKVENTDEENGMVWLIVEIADEIFDLVLEIVPDVIPPTITIVSPDEGLYLGGNKVINLGQIIIIIGRVGIATNVIDEENGTGISHVKFFVDDELKYNDTDAFYEWIWDETAFLSHKLKVIAYDNAYNMASDEVEVWKFF